MLSLIVTLANVDIDKNLIIYKIVLINRKLVNHSEISASDFGIDQMESDILLFLHDDYSSWIM